MELIDKYEVSNEKQERLNQVKTGGTTSVSRTKRQVYDIWFNSLYNLNLKLNNIKDKYEKDKYEKKAHVFDVLPEEYEPVRVSCK